MYIVFEVHLSEPENEYKCIFMKKMSLFRSDRPDRSEMVREIMREIV